MMTDGRTHGSEEEEEEEGKAMIKKEEHHEKTKPQHPHFLKVSQFIISIQSLISLSVYLAIYSIVSIYSKVPFLRFVCHHQENKVARSTLLQMEGGPH